MPSAPHPLTPAGFSGYLSAFLQSIFNLFFGFFQPKYKKEAHYMIKEATRYYNYKRDILPEEKKEELVSRIKDVKKALTQKNKGLTESKISLLEQYMSTLPGSWRGALSENIESFFVIFAIFIGLNAYIAQPFRIPTGSMQPSLNGIRAFSLTPEEIPSFPGKVWDAITLGSSYKYIVADKRKTITDMQGTTFLVFTQTKVSFDDGSSIELPGSTGEIARFFATTKGSPRPTFEKGEVIVNARFDAGDVVLVNKVSYHFRRPERGEVFVFDTRNIFNLGELLEDRSQLGVHYIKRLVGVPGDTVQISPPYLIINGEKAKESTIQRVAAGQPPYNEGGYQFAEVDPRKYKRPPLSTLADKMELKKNITFPQMSEYAAMGDNTNSSLDSRYWGSVKQYNVIGPALFNFWPFTKHWGYIP